MAKSWKEVFLSSGIPLEYSVSRVLEELEGWGPSEFRYEREDANGITRVFSVDVHSSHIDTQRNVWLETLVECKYRHDGTRWVFTPRQYELMSEDFGDLFVTLDHCCPERKLNRAHVSGFRGEYALCGKGIELLPGEANPKTIEQAVQQLRHAVVAKASDAIVHQVDGLLGQPTPLFVIVPIIVTTAELWRLKPGCTVEDVRGAGEIGEVADRQDLLVLHDEPDNLDRRESLRRFYADLDEAQREKLDVALRANSRMGAAHYLDLFASRQPFLFLIVTYDRFASAAGNLYKFIEHETLVEARNSG